MQICTNLVCNNVTVADCDWCLYTIINKMPQQDASVQNHYAQNISRNAYEYLEIKQQYQSKICKLKFLDSKSCSVLWLIPSLNTMKNIFSWNRKKNLYFITTWLLQSRQITCQLRIMNEGNIWQQTSYLESDLILCGIGLNHQYIYLKVTKST
jgi:hypothetical protein